MLELRETLDTRNFAQQFAHSQFLVNYGTETLSPLRLKTTHGRTREFLSRPSLVQARAQTLDRFIDGKENAHRAVGTIGEWVGKEILEEIFGDECIVRITPTELDDPTGTETKEPLKGIGSSLQPQSLDIILAKKSCPEVDEYEGIVGFDITMWQEKEIPKNVNQDPLNIKPQDQIPVLDKKRNRSGTVPALEMPVLVTSLGDLPYVNNYNEEVGIEGYCQELRYYMSNNDYIPLWKEDPQIKEAWKYIMAREIARGVNYCRKALYVKYSKLKDLKKTDRIFIDNLTSKLNYVEGKIHPILSAMALAA
jgi:hypothetical protein